MTGVAEAQAVSGFCLRFAQLSCTRVVHWQEREHHPALTHHPHTDHCVLAFKHSGTSRHQSDVVPALIYPAILSSSHSTLRLFATSEFTSRYFFFFFLIIRPPPRSPLFPHPPLFR